MDDVDRQYVALLVDTTNIYAELDLETKARALAACAIDDGKRSRKPWRQQHALMEFLHAL
jgi:hypothetical protein